MKDGDYIEHLFVCSIARLPAVLLQPRQGLPLEGLRAAGGAAHGEGPRAGQRPAAARGRAHPVGALHARLLRGASTSSSRPASGTVKKTEFARLQHADQGRRHHRDQHPRRRRARRRAPRRRRATRSSWSRSAGLAVRFARGRRARDGPRHQRRARHERLRQGQRGARDGRRARRPGAARRHRERLRQAHADRRVPQDLARRQGRQDDQVHREARAASPARSSCASTRSSCSSPRTAWSSAPACAGIRQTGPRGAGRDA